MESFRVWYLMDSVVITSIYTRISECSQNLNFFNPSMSDTIHKVVVDVTRLTEEVSPVKMSI